MEIGNSFGAVTSVVSRLTVSPVVPLAEAVDVPQWVWSPGGVTPWFGQVNLTYDGADAPRSGPIWFRDTNWMEATVGGPGLVSF